MTAVFVAWQDTALTRSWHPIGRLDQLDGGDYVFRYVKGVNEAEERAGFRPLAAFPEIDKVYRSESLFSFFGNRIMSPNREDFEEFTSQLGLDARHADPMHILAASGGRRQTDSFEVFPTPKPDGEGRYHYRCFLHGWRHTSDAAQNRIESLESGDELRIACEVDNPVTGLAFQVQTDDYHMIGWMPRYLIADLRTAMGRLDEFRHKLSVARLNPDPVSHHYRVILEMAMELPGGVTPFFSEEFHPLAPVEAFSLHSR